MLVLQADNSVIRLQFLPDGRRLLAWVLSGQEVVNFDIWTRPDGGRVRLPLQRLNVYTWRNWGLEGNAVAALVLLGVLGVAVSSVGAPDAELTPAQRKDLGHRANEANQLRGW
jgi:hypothetical protein